MSFLSFLLEKDIINSDLYDLILAKTGDIDNYAYDLLISIGDITEEELAKLKAKYFHINYTDLDDFSRIDGIQYDEFKEFLAVPFKISSQYIHIAINDPDNIETKDKINTKLSSCDSIKDLNKIYYTAKKSDIIHKFQEVNNSEISVLEKTILWAINKKASDIHITPFEKTFEINFRIDGTLINFKTLNIENFEELIISIKVISKLDISETRKPQSGHFQKNNIDFRVSTHPTIYGENVVIRILNKDKAIIDIENLGFCKKQIKYLKTIGSFSNGIIIFCGPTGSGKTTSIYSIIETINKKSKNIMTLEDPVEYKIKNAKQTEIKPGVIDFPDGIKSILRQDPDIILIGEIRDEKTAKMAIRAAMTGHLVLTTVHANDSFGAIARLKEFDIPQTLIADN
ncbi:MAG: Flp pilus assembly complex ATPase component TadA, partial [Holosporales bacterium]|nr:Flp pilus assembly complex ATPase component TadA [Holosporales bacterium]